MRTSEEINKRYFPVFSKILDLFLCFLVFSLLVGRINLKPFGIPLSWGRSLENLVFAYYLVWLTGMIIFRRRLIKTSSWDPPIWCFILFLALSTWHTFGHNRAFPGFSSFPLVIGDSLNNFRALLTGWLIFLAVISGDHLRPRLALLKKTILIASLVFCTIGLARYASGIYYSYADRRLSTASLHPNGVAMYLAMISPLVIFSLFQSRNRLERLAWGLLSLLLLVSLSLTFSRSGWVAFLFATGTLMIRAGRRRMNHLILLILLLAVGGGLLFPRVRQRVLSIPAWATDKNMERRLTYARAALRMAGEHPFWGVGYGSLAFRNAYFKYYWEKDTGEDVWDPHNLYLNLAATAGLPALVFFLWLVFLVLATYFRPPRREDEEMFGWGVSFQAGFLGFLIIGLVESPFYTPQLSAFFWFFLALGALVSGAVRSATQIN